MNFDFHLSNIWEEEIFYISLVSGLIYLILVNLISKEKSKFFPKMKEFGNKKLHTFKYRGLGILYIVSLIPFFYFYFSYFSTNSIILIYILTLLGFVDDKFDLSSKFKLAIFIIICLIYNFFETSLQFNTISLTETLEILNKSFFLLFLILFFNQIDGINGLAGLTYFVSIFTISIFFGNLVLFLPILVIVVVYLFFNLKGKVGIQGDSGSYFFAATFFILITRFTDNLNFFHSLLFLCPVLFDVVSTTIIRIIMFKNILKPHTNNIYQKMAIIYKNPLKSTFCFVFFQIVFSLIVLYLFHINNVVLVIIFTFSIFMFFIYLAYLNHRGKIFKEKNI